MPRAVRTGAYTEHRPAGWAEVRPVPLHARGYSSNVGNVRIAQPHHVGGACLLHLRGSPILRVRGGERAGEHRNQDSGDENRCAARELDATVLDELWQCYAPIR